MLPVRNAGSEGNPNKSIFDYPELNKFFQKLLLNLLNQNVKIYLDGLGILFTKEEQLRSTQLSNDHEQTVFVDQSYKQICFEKSYEINSLHFNTFANILETRELACRIHARIKHHLKNKLTISFVHEELKKYCNSIRTELLTSGISQKLPLIGTFYALKLLDEASNWRDKFGNANIILITNKELNKQHVTPEDLPSSFKTPVFKTSWEPFEAHFNQALECRKINFLDELDKIGLNPDELELQPEDYECELSIIAIQKHKQEDQLLFCTNGIQRITQTHNPDFTATELTVQISQPKGLAIPEWPIKLLTLAWILINSSQDKAIRSGVLLKYELFNYFSQNSNLNGILTCKNHYLPGRYLSTSGKFRYLNLIGITGEEIEFADRYGNTALVDILKYKEHDRITRIRRRNVL